MKTLLVLLALCGDVTKLACPAQAVAASLTPDDCSAHDTSRYDEWTFAGGAGQTVTIAMSSTSFDTLLILLDPSGKPVAVNDDATGTDSRLAFTLDATGTWTIVANSLATNGLGSYVLYADLGCPIVPGVRRRAVTK